MGPTVQTATFRVRPEAVRSAKETPVTPSLAKAAAVNGKLHSPEVAKPLKYEDDRALFQLFAEKNAEAAEKPKTAKKKWMIIAPVSGGSVLLVLGLAFLMFHHGAKPAAKPSVETTSQITDTQPGPDPSNTPGVHPQRRLSPRQQPESNPQPTLRPATDRTA